jgi:CDP-diacylglycerol--glycerol-3-phosphate 3-phosphatidyltransferase
LSKGGFKQEVLNLPNIITIGRLLLIPPVLLLVDPYDAMKSFFALLLFAFASFLDLIDGWLARRSGLVTVFGKFMDPLADKIMVMALLVYLVHVDSVPPWVVVLLLGRDLYVSGLRSLASAEGLVISAGFGGKKKTVFQMVGICAVIVRHPYRLPFTEITVDYHLLGMALIYVSVLLSVISAAQYTIGFRAALGPDRKG